MTQPQPIQDDETEAIRRKLQADLNSDAVARRDLESRYGQVWSTKEMSADFEALQFSAPFLVVRRKSDRQLGSLMFQNDPRFYFNFAPDVP
jgi:hypothetical protein